jgi:alkylation response protein AidB-like acyl-CoA dehydrogenase
MAQGAYESAAKYAKQRNSSANPLRIFKPLSSRSRIWLCKLMPRRLLTYRAAWLADRALVSPDATTRSSLESSMAKLDAREVAVRVANEAVQIHGGYGFIKDYPAEKFYRDVKLCMIGEGTGEIQRLVIARQILGKC